MPCVRSVRRWSLPRARTLPKGSYAATRPRRSIPLPVPQHDNMPISLDMAYWSARTFLRPGRLGSPQVGCVVADCHALWFASTFPG